MKVIVTGVSGFIGGQTALQLRDAGHEVWGIDCRPLPDHLQDVCHAFLLQDFSNDIALGWIAYYAPDAIIHCAGTSLVGPSVQDPMTYWVNNVYKNIILLNKLVESKLQTRFIFSSSAATYGNPVMNPCQEIDPLEPISPYGQTKLTMEWILKSYHTAYNFDYVAFRYFNACGADSQGRHGQESNATHIIARVLESIKNNATFTCNGNNYQTDDGTCVRDYIHVEDIANAHILALNHAVPIGSYNIGTDSGASNLEVINTAFSVTGTHKDIVFGPIREGDPAVLTADASKYKTVSNWKPKFNLHDMVSHAWKWYNKTT
jgi:UDP-glucose 4-epimerase